MIAAPAAPALPETPTDAAAPVPSIEAAGSGSGSTSPAIVAFESQTRDPSWAPKIEKEIAQRFKKVRGGKLQSTECRHSACRLTINGSEGDVGQTIADLESPRGMHGFAENIVLSAPEKQADGTIVLRATANFARPEK